MIAMYRRLTSLDRSDRRLVLEAASLLTLVWIGLRLLGFSKVRRILEPYRGSPRAGNGDRAHPSAIGRVSWAITAVAARLPWTNCLVRAFAADVMLRRRRLGSEVCLGVRVRDGVLRIEGHAWVECDGAVAIGAIENLSDFKLLTVLRPQ